MRRYIEGYYCPTEFDLQILNKKSNLDILNALFESYPSSLTTDEIEKKTDLSTKTIYPQTDELYREFYINEITKPPKQRGRPKTSAQRKKMSFVIENATKLFDVNNGKKDTSLPPGNVSFSEDFAKTIPKIVEKNDQDEINNILLNTLKKIYRVTTESKDKDIRNLAPSKYKGRDKENEDYRCSQCGLNHEARDFIRAVLLYLIDQFEQSKNFIDFLKENELVTNDAYTNVVKKLKDL